MNSGLMRGTLLGIWDTSLAESRMYIIGSHSSPADVGDTIHSAGHPVQVSPQTTNTTHSQSAVSVIRHPPPLSRALSRP